MVSCSRIKKKRFYKSPGPEHLLTHAIAMSSPDHRITTIEHNMRLLSDHFKSYSDRVEHVESASKLSEQYFNHRITAVEGNTLAFNWQLNFFDAKFGKRLDGMESKIIALDKKVDERMDKVENRMGSMETRMDKIETRMEGMETRMDKIETHMDSMEKKMDHVIVLIESLNTKLATLAPAF